jgi:hypothetical protein
MRKEIHPQNEMVKGTLSMMTLRALIGGDARWRQMTRARGLVPGEVRGAQ